MSKKEQHTQLLEELEASQKEAAVTIEEVQERSEGGFRKGQALFPFVKRSFLAMFVILLVVIGILLGGLYFWKNGSTFTEQKGAFLERIQEMKELTTAEAYTKVIIERQDNQLFGQSIGIDLPGTKRQLLVVVPGSIKAGIDLSTIQEENVVVDEQQKRITLTVPNAQLLGGPQIYFDQVEVYSYEGLFRAKADIEEAYDLAEEAKRLIATEATEQGVLEMAQLNAARTLEEMFSFTGYEVTVKFEE